MIFLPIENVGRKIKKNATQMMIFLPIENVGRKIKKRNTDDDFPPHWKCGSENNKTADSRFHVTFLDGAFRMRDSEYYSRSRF